MLDTSFASYDFLVKKVSLFLLFLGLFGSLPFVAFRYTKGFKLSKIHLVMDHHPEWDVEMTEEIFRILDQPFSFLGKGKQCYAFVSQDKKYVIKLFRSYKSSVCYRNALVMDRAKLAYDKLKEETGLLYLHLNETKNALPVIRLQDPIGRTLKLPLDQYRFVVQKRACSFSEALDKAKQNPEELKARIDQIVELLVTRTEKKIKNLDPNLMRNFGFLQDSAMEIDFGSYKEEPDLDQMQELKRYTNQLRKWLSIHSPEWVAYLDEQVAK